MKIRTQIKPEDVANIREIVSSTNFFHDYEIDVAVELSEDKLANGHESSYQFIFVEMDDKTVAYSCFGLIPCTQSSYDLYWIVVHNNYRKLGIGKKLLALTELAIAKSGGTAVYAETSSQELYEPTRKFYLSNNYKEEARLKNFYKYGDDKLIYSRQVVR